MNLITVIIIICVTRTHLEVITEEIRQPQGGATFGFKLFLDTISHVTRQNEVMERHLVAVLCRDAVFLTEYPHHSGKRLHGQTKHHVNYLDISPCFLAWNPCCVSINCVSSAW